MKTSLETVVSQRFSYLFSQYGFEFEHVGEDYDGCIVIARSASLRLRFIVDRSDFFLDVASTKYPEHWLRFYEILEELRRRGAISGTYKCVNKINIVAGLFRESFMQIDKYVGDTNATV